MKPAFILCLTFGLYHISQGNAAYPLLTMSTKKWENKVVQVTVQDTNSVTVQGQLLAVNDSAIYLFVSNQHYQLYPNDSLIARIPSSKIDRIVLNKNSLALKGAKIGALTSVAAPIYVTILFAAEGSLGYAVLAAPAVWLATLITNTAAGGIIGHLNYINADYKFSMHKGTFGSLKEEIKNYALTSYIDDSIELNDYSSFHNPDIKLSTYIKKPYDPLFFSRLSLSLGIGYNFTNAQNDQKIAHINQLESSEDNVSFFDQHMDKDIHLDLGLTIKPHIQASVGIKTFSSSLMLTRIDPVDDMNYTDLQYLSTFVSGNMGINYIINPTRRIRIRKHEFSCGGALHFASLTGSYEVYENTSSLSNDYNIPVNTRYTKGVSLHAKYETYPIRQVSFYIKGGVALYSKLKTSEVDISLAGYRATMVQPYSINFSSVYINAGIAVHIF